ncbi:MAG TPA: ABC transporter substrate-binding protein [Syntrophales bacterium]|nr:ABC transporter substrate-binding protein [Syntrophales bacterium]
MKKLVGLIAVYLLIGFFTVNASAQESIKLTVPLPLTGSQATFGQIEKRSYEIAMEEINAARGIKRRKLLLDFEDSKGKPEISRSIAEKLIDVNKQPIIFGEYSSSCSEALAELAERRRVPYLVVTGAADDITQQRYRYVYRMNPTTAYYASGLMSFLKKVVKPVTMAILYESSDFGVSGAEDMSKQARKAGIKIVLKEPYDRETIDYVTYDVRPIPDVRLMLAKVKASNPDVIYMVSYAMDAVEIMRELQSRRIDARLYAGGAAGFAVPDFIQGAKDAAEYVVTSTLWSPWSNYPGARDFAEKYKKRYGDYPSYHGAEAYAALYVVKNVLERARSWKPEDIRIAMGATNMMTAFGPVKFEDKEGYTNQNFMDTLVMQVIGGQYEIIWPEKSVSKRYIYPIPRWRDR